MRKIWLHIGTPKTGTTAIQNFFTRHQQIAIESEQAPYDYVKYMAVGRVSRAQHGLVAAAVGDHKPDWIPDYPLEEIKDELQELPSEGSFFCSSEAFSSIRFIRAGGVESLRQLWPDDDVRVIVYLRNQASYLESAYLQQMKTGAYRGTIDTYFDRVSKTFMHYENTLNAYGTVFGHSNMHVISYDQEKSDVLGSLFKIFDPIGHKVTMEKEKAALNDRANVGGRFISSHLLSRISLLTKQRLIGPTYLKLRDFVEGNVCDDMAYTMLSPGLLSKLQAEYAEENARINARYGINLHIPQTLPDNKVLFDADTINIRKHLAELLIAKFRE